MKQFIYTFLCALPLCTLSAQESHSIDFLASDWLIPVDMVNDEQHLYLLCEVDTDLFPLNNHLLIKYHPAQGLIWAKQFGTDQNARSTRLLRLANGNLLVMGNYFNSPLQSISMHAICLSTEGDIRWQQVYDQTRAFGSEIAAALELPDGSLILAGTTQDGHGATDWYFAKVDQNGQAQKGLQLGGTDYEYLNDLTLGDDGHVYAAARTRSLSVDTKKYEAAIVQVDTALNAPIIYRMQQDGSSQEYFQRLQATSDGRLLIGGSTSSGHITGFWSPGQSTIDLFAVNFGFPVSILPLPGDDFLIHSSSSDIFQLGSDGHFLTRYFQDSEVRGNRASTRLPNGQLAFSGFSIDPTDNKRITNLVLSEPDAIPGCSGYFSTYFDTTHLSLPIHSPVLPSQTGITSAQTDLTVLDYSLSVSELCRQVCNDQPSAAFTYTTAGNTADLSLNESFTQNTDRTYWIFPNGERIQNQPQLTYNFGQEDVYDVCAVVHTTCGSDTVCQTIDLLSTSVTKLEESSVVEVWPNPTSDIFNVRAAAETRIREVVLYDALGRRLNVASTRLAPNHYILSAANLPGGSYTIQLFDEHGTPGIIRVQKTN